MSDGVIRGRILKVTLGNNPKDGLAFRVGQEFPDFKIHSIVIDKNYLFKYGIEKVLIIAENKEKVRWAWKEATGVPYLLDYFDPKGSPEDHI